MQPAAVASGTDHVDWQAVVDRLEGRPGLTTPELDELSRAHWWLGHLPEAIRCDELVHERYVAEGRLVEAAERALRICLEWGTRGDVAVATAWRSRAARLLADQPTSRVHGFAAYVAGAMDLDLDGDADAAAAAARELTATARRLDDRVLECFALTVGGLAAVRRGDLRGFAALDEAIIPVLQGQVDPLWAGDIYCSVVHLCEAVGDLARMRSWTDAMASWAGPLSDSFLYAGVTRIHQLQLLLAEGAWDLVEQELEARSDGLAVANGWVAGTGFYELGELHRLRGRDAAARAAYDRARSLGVDPQPGEALLLHGQGRTGEALDGVRIALAGQRSLARARMLRAATELALAVGDPALADACATDLEAIAARYGTPGLLADAAVARAACLVAAGTPAEAVELLEQAARTYREQRHQHALARVHEALAGAHAAAGATEPAHAAEATARAIYERLGAVADLARLAPTTRPAGLTVREAEVLAQVAAGLTNREVARALVISEKTVSRHLTSIFTKAGVTSRTAAAAWAREHDLV